MTSEQESSSSADYGHHLTIGPHGGIDWARRLGVETSAGRKTSDSEMSGASNSGDELAIHKSSDCISAKELNVSSENLVR